MTVTIRAILERGYLPKELPPCFTSAPFAKVASSLSAMPQERDWTKAATFSLSRPGGLRRSLAITNPFTQFHIATQCVGGWSELQAHFGRSHIALSRPVEGTIRSMDPKTKFSDQIRPRLERMNRARFMLSTDVSQFYSSIYTHSLGWALDGKAASKQRLTSRTRGAQTLGERLDRAIRNGQEGQTKGIPIGPDSSFLAGEILLSAIDAAVEAKFPHFARSAMRFYDDLEYFASTRTEAEDLLVAWESELARYELTLNADKTRIIEAPIGLQLPWFSALAAVRIRRTSESTTANDIISYFDKAFQLAGQYPRDSVISYAIQRFRRWPFTSESWRSYSRLLLPAVIAEPSSLPHAAYAIARARAGGLRVDALRLQETLNDLIRHHAPLSHGAEVVWALWMLAQNGAQLEPDGIRAVATMEDNACLLLLLHLRDKGFAIDEPGMTPVLGRAGASSAINSGDWLLAYEATHQKWESNPSVRKHKGFVELLDRDVTFFNPRLRLALKLKAKPKPSPLPRPKRPRKPKVETEPLAPEY